MEELVEKLNLPYISALDRFLNACIALKLIKQDKTDNLYSNTRLSEKYLVSTSPTTLNGFININNQSAYLMWHNLANGIRENASQWKQIFGTVDGDEFTFNTIYQDENVEVTFISAMYGLGLTSSPPVIAALDNVLEYKKFCDVGGATGHLAVSACQVNPHLQAIIFDLPGIEKHAIRYIETILSEIRDRINFQSGDFFIDPLPQVDLFGLGRILHDWKDEQCEQLLIKIYQALPENGGALLIAEKLFDDYKTGPVEVNMQDIHMLLRTAGRERTGPEYTSMLEKVGFKNIRCQRTGAYLDAIIGYK